MTSDSVYYRTPSVSVLDNRGLNVRNIEYYRHPDTPDVTEERITHHQYDARKFLIRSADPRLYDAGQANVVYQNDLSGNVLRAQSCDAGITVTLNDTGGRPFMMVSNIGTADDGTQDRSQALTRTWQYEKAELAGRLLSITEQVNGEAARITERFIYAGNSQAEKDRNVVGLCISHYDTAGLVQTQSVALTGIPLSITRQLLATADNPDTVADWQGEDASAWNDLLAAEAYTTLITADATGAALTTTDAAGNKQRVAYDVAGQLASSWLTVKDSPEQAIVKSLTYSAAGQKLREEHGNGVVTTYTYEPETQRPTGIRTARPVGHALGIKVLQDLHYEYDPVGNVLSIINDAEETRFWRNQKVAPENTYVYDSLYQLVSASGREMANAGQQGSALPSVSSFDDATYTNHTRIYSYDSGGNLTQIRHSASATGNNYTTNFTISDRSNRGVLSTLTENPEEVDALFTASGQQAQLQPGQTLSWTARNELLKVNPVVRDGAVDDGECYRYDSSSQRVLKVSVQKTAGSSQTQQVLYLPGLELRTTANGGGVAERLQVIIAGEAGRAQVRVLHWESGTPADIVNNSLRYSYSNLTGSSILELDGEGNVISLEEYYPYGGTAILTARSQTEVDYKTIRYSGKERDATGLYYYGYRYYQPWAGRWLSADPSGTVDGLNLFAMVANNPVTFFDSNGLSRTRTERINEYAEFLDAAKSAVYKIHTYLDALANPSRMMAAELRSVARRATIFGTKVAGLIGGTAAGTAIGVSVVVAGPVGPIVVGSALVGSIIGGLAAGLISNKAFDLGVNAYFDKNKFQPTRVQTSKIKQSLERAGGNYFVTMGKEQLDRREQAKNAGVMLVSSTVKDYLGIRLPIKDILDVGSELMDFRGITIAKREKINRVLDTISTRLTSEIHNEIMGLFDEKGTTSVRKFGTLNTGLLYAASYKKEELSEIRMLLLNRVDDVRRMLHNPEIYKGSSAREQVSREARFFHRGVITRRASI